MTSYPPRRKPETDGLRNLVTPSVDAWARWAVPKAKMRADEDRA